MHDVVVVGAGPVGATFALALRHADLDIVVLDARAADEAARADRSLALSHGARLILERLGVWTPLAGTAGAVTPIFTIDISQARGFGSVERRLQRAIRDDVTERRQSVLGGRELDAAEAARLRDVDRCNRRDGTRGARERRPHAEALEDQPRAVRQRKRAIGARRFARGARVQHDGVEIGMPQRERERRAYRAGTDDDDVVQVQAAAVRRRRPRRRPPTWAWRL